MGYQKMNQEDFKIVKHGTIEHWYDKETNDLRKIIVSYANGVNHIEEYQLNGKRHREDGPATQYWTTGGMIYHESYYLNGKQYSKEEYDKIMLAKKFELI
jgi:hypothetical protein